MAAINKAIEAMKLQEPGECLSYRACAKQFCVDRTTLSQRCQGFQQSITAANLNKQKLHPQEEDELVRYVNDLTKRGLPPTREMTRKFGEEIAHKHIGDGWVTRFVDQNDDYLISRWTKGKDAVRHHADSEAKYDLYFDLLHGKITQYDVEPAHTYNMVEKGFAIGVIGKQKWIFNKRMWQSGEVS
ncbi:hypothetical protein EK21DRAFT_119332 [Setomelanomma holmii]|uniref:HTH CENPB-type domain-containing protein n=1 Tax=Setomelanomma holmii TaxID=210430 RepID=A0A9P4GW10_9PLEO|nr:hypothetical protein EK21DRAFT_119332 [Setomelanomma holmii]